MKPRYITTLHQIPQLTDAERRALAPVVERFAFRVNDYYLSLIDWADPDDPIRRLVIPDGRELETFGHLDASQESAYTPVPGLEHKYRSTALLLVNDVCGAYCRFCFRKRLFMKGNGEVDRDIGPGLEYIRRHREISNVLLTGGDPLLLSTRRLRAIIEALREIDHVRIIRIGSKMPAFNPFRIINDAELLQVLATHSTPKRRIYVMMHFNHPREITPEARHGINLLVQSGVVVANQCPLLQGINDSAGTLAELFTKVAEMGVTPYYLFINRPVSGNKMFTVPIENAHRMFMTAQRRLCGLAKRARLMMSHATGKIEVVGVLDEWAFFRYHSAAQSENLGRFFKLRSNPAATWIDEYADFAPTGPEFSGSQRSTAIGVGTLGPEP